MHFNRHDTVVVFIDPGGEPASEESGAHARETVENMARIRRAALRSGFKVFVAPHYFYATDDARSRGPREPVDLVLQLRRHGVRQIILGGMSANMCAEAQLRELLEQGFAVIVAKDATTGPRHPDWGDGYMAALIDFAFLAHAVLSTEELVTAMGRVAGESMDVKDCA
jgi:hypothetical protein